MMISPKNFISILFFLSTSFLLAQDYYWTGNGEDQDFFNEANWINPSTNQPPENGSIEPSQPINFDLLLSCEASTIPSEETDIISQTPALFSEVSNNDNWSHFYRATSLNDGNNGAQQNFVINVTSLPVGGANFRDIRTVANGQWAFGNSQALTLGVNTITVNEVSFNRAVKIQFSSGYIAFDALFLNGNSIYSAPSEPIVFEPSKTLYISNGILNVSSFSGGNLILNENSYVNLNDTDPLLNNAKVYFNSSISWLRLENVNPNQVHDTYISQMFVSDTNAEYPTSIRLDNYYDNGTVVRPQSLDTTPLTIYSNEDNTGTEAEIVVNQVYSGSSIPNQMNNNIHSFYLKRGYMLTIAVNDDGTGKSKVFIASEEDLEIHALPNFFQAGISFIRVIPWNWVSKRGTGGDIAGMDNTWFYRWNNQGFSDLQRECSPMAWGYANADDSNDINLYQSKYKTTHVLGFNEPDDCNGQSGQYNDLCTVSTAVEVYENLMKTGLRIVSPACRQDAVFTWLDLFNQQAIQEDIRIDVIAVHWYDWGGNPQDSPNADPNAIFNRFKNYLQNVYALYGLPIWITEFNGNKYRSTQTNLQFMELAVPYLEDLDFVERYAWFEPQNIDIPQDPGNGEFFDVNMNLTDIGMFYKNQTSGPSISASYYSGHNNLNDEILVNQYAYLCTPITPCSGISTTWDGFTWSNGAPDTNSYAIISGAYSTATNGNLTACVMQVDADVTIEGAIDTAVSEVIVTTGNTLTIDHSSSLRVSGDFTNSGTVTLNSTADDFSSLIVEGTATGDILYNRYVNMYNDSPGASSWDLVGTPAGMTIADFVTANGANIKVLGDNYAFAQFNNATGQWERYQTASQGGSFEAGKGYSMATTSGTTVAFTGDMQTTDQSINIINNDAANQGAGRRWNLMSNPFPCYIYGNTAAGAENFLDANTAAIDSERLAVYGWNGSSYTIYNNSSGAFSMAPGQGFWVAAANTTDTALNFTAAMRTTTGTGDFVTGPQLLSYEIGLNLYNGEIEKAKIKFYFKDGLTLNLDPGYDAAAFNQSMALSTRLPQGNHETAFSINAMDISSMQNTRIPLEIRQTAGQAFRISIAEMDLPQDIQIYLEDTLNGTLTSLNDGDFELTAQSNLSGADRFYIVFKSTSVLSTESAPGIEGLNVYKANNESFITIAGISPDLQQLDVRLYSMLGVAVKQAIFNTTTSSQRVSTAGLASGLYIVQIKSENQTTIKKIIIK